MDSLDATLLPHVHRQVQVKKTSVAADSTSVGLNIHKGKSEILKYNKENINQITIDGETLEDVESFTYLRSIIDEQRGCDADVNARIGKATTAFLQLKYIWNSKQLFNNIEVTIFNIDAKQFYCTGLKLRELSRPSSREYKY
ncbi:unnamed protein product [Schistosoma margrebowiei]|uniref:Uncharacterized protein n=1 Tax=Schistosoma margrebowiei TaxID=48269 RepID=A0A183LKZ9_9TREM|nr:unnamed protein product [Schistosoma margrebowiei]